MRCVAWGIIRESLYTPASQPVEGGRWFQYDDERHSSTQASKPCQLPHRPVVDVVSSSACIVSSAAYAPEFVAKVGAAVDDGVTRLDTSLGSVAAGALDHDATARSVALGKLHAEWLVHVDLCGSRNAGEGTRGRRRPHRDLLTLGGRLPSNWRCHHTPTARRCRGAAGNQLLDRPSERLWCRMQVLRGRCSGCRHTLITAMRSRCCTCMAMDATGEESTPHVATTMLLRYVYLYVSMRRAQQMQ